MQRSHRLWAAFLSLSAVFFFLHQYIPETFVGQIIATEEPIPARSMIIDDADEVRFQTEGEGWTKSGFPVGYRGSVWMHKSTPTASHPQASARWTFGALPAGTYEVYATWVWGKTLPTAVSYAVTAADGNMTDAMVLLSASVNQQQQPTGPRWEGSMYPWQKLGTVQIPRAGLALTVSINGDNTDTFSADAVLVLPLESVAEIASASPTPIPSISSSSDVSSISSVASAMETVSSIDVYASSDSSASTETIPEMFEAQWVPVGPPHTPFSSCTLECAKTGTVCMENACNSFQTVWDGNTWTGGQKLKANDVLLFHNSCDATWGNLSPSLRNECCCTTAATAVSTSPVCGDGTVQAPEECDDGNGKPGDGCGTACVREFCGDGIVNVDLGEECDDVQTQFSSDIACSAQCMWEYCGDGILQTMRNEECDDGNRRDGDGCTAACRLR